MKRLLAALMALCFATPAFAQVLGTKPPDVPAYDSTTNPISYATGVTLNKLGNGVDPDGGTPPAAAYELADIPSTETGWIATTGNIPATGSENKFRATAVVTGINYDDPIRFYGQPGTSHCHMHFGAQPSPAHATFAWLRNSTVAVKSRFQGGPYNNTGYWFPCFQITNAFGDGKNYAVQPDLITVYYNGGASTVSNAQKFTYYLNGLRWVGGYHVDNPNFYTELVAAANAAAGSTRYHVSDPANANGGTELYTHTYKCESTGQFSPTLALAGGADPWASLPGGTCPSTSKITLQFSGPSCWDGINFWSTSGYSHFIYKIYDSVAGASICPNGWYMLPHLELFIAFTHEGATGARGYTNWKLSSDGSNLAGKTFHTDWLGAWDRTTLRKWMDNCIGVSDPATPRECNGGSLGNGEELLSISGQAPTGRTPQLDTSVKGTSDASKMFELSTTHSGPATMHAHGAIP